MPALALIFEVAERVENCSGPGRIGEASALRAVEWTRLLEQHARRIYAAATNGDAAGARVLADKLRSGAIKDGFRARDVYRRQWAGLSDKDETNAAIAMLTDLGWLREERLAPGSKGGQPGEVYRINPAARGSVSSVSSNDATKAAESPERGSSVSSVSLGGPHFSSSSSSGGEFFGPSSKDWPDRTDRTSAPPHDPITGEVLP